MIAVVCGNVDGFEHVADALENVADDFRRALQGAKTEEEIEALSKQAALFWEKMQEVAATASQKCGHCKKVLHRIDSR